MQSLATIIVLTRVATSRFFAVESSSIVFCILCYIFFLAHIIIPFIESRVIFLSYTTRNIDDLLIRIEADTLYARYEFFTSISIFFIYLTRELFSPQGQIFRCDRIIFASIYLDISRGEMMSLMIDIVMTVLFEKAHITSFSITVRFCDTM